MVLRQVSAIDLVVGTHNRPGFAFFNGYLKARQIYFPQGALINNGVDHHATRFMIVHGEVFYAGANPFTLNALNKPASQFSG